MMAALAGDRLWTRFAALAALLGLLWGYAVYLTGRDAADLVRIRVLGAELGQPTDELIRHLQAERRLTVVELAAPGGQRDALVAQRGRTDAVVARLRGSAAAADVRLAATPPVRRRADELVRRLDALGPLRAAADAGQLDRARAATGYAELVDAGFGVHSARWTSRESELIERTRAFVALARARELLAREDAVVAGILTAGRITTAERSGLADLVAGQRLVRAEAATGLPEPARGRYQSFADSDALRTLRGLEDRLVTAARTGGSSGGRTGGTNAGGTNPGGTNPGGTSSGATPPDGAGTDSAAPVPPIDPRAWRAAAESVLAGLRELVADGVRDSAARATPSAVAMVVRIGLVGGVGLVAVVAILLGTVRDARRSSRRLDRLRDLAQRLADDELPGLAGRPSRDETVVAGAGWPAPAPGPDPVDRVGQALDAVRRSAARVLAEQTELKRQNRDLFLDLTRRNQALLRRQLHLLDALQRRETDAEELSDLFRVDHLATRVRRNVETLITAAGGVPARRWRRPVPLVDLVRGAVAEVEDYQRVLVAPDWRGSLVGPAVNDLTHLLAELIENGLTYSPATSAVRVSGDHQGPDRTIEIRDAGPGMDPEALAVINTLLRDPPPTRPAEIGRGLYLVACLAQRWDVGVELGRSPRVGTTARVRIPETLVMAGAPADETANLPTAELPRLPIGDEEHPPVIPASGRRGGPVSDRGGNPP